MIFLFQLPYPQNPRRQNLRGFCILAFSLSRLRPCRAFRAGPRCLCIRHTRPAPPRPGRGPRARAAVLNQPARRLGRPRARRSGRRAQAGSQTRTPPREGSGAFFLERVREEALEEGPGGRPRRSSPRICRRRASARICPRSPRRAGRRPQPSAAQLKTRFPSPNSPFSSPSRRTRLKAKRASGAGSSSCSCARTLARMSPRAGLVRRAEVGVEPAAGEAVAVPERVKIASRPPRRRGLRPPPCSRAGPLPASRPRPRPQSRRAGSAARPHSSSPSARFPASGMPSRPERSALASQSRAAGEAAYSGRLAASRAAKYMSASSPPSIGVHELRGALEAQQLHGPFRPRGVIVLRRPGYPLVRARHGEDQGLRSGRLLRLRRRALRRGLSAAGRKRQD